MIVSICVWNLLQIYSSQWEKYVLKDIEMQIVEQIQQFKSGLCVEICKCGLNWKE